MAEPTFKVEVLFGTLEHERRPCSTPADRDGWFALFENRWVHRDRDGRVITYGPWQPDPVRIRFP